MGIGIFIGNRIGSGKDSTPVVPVVPAFVSAVVENAAPTHVIVTFDIPLNETASGGFTLAGKTISNESISGAVITLTVTVAYAYGNTPTVVYTKPGTNPLKSLTNGEVASFSQAVTNNITWPALAPSGLSLTVDSYTQITASWTNNDTTGDGSKLEISTNGIDYIVCAVNAIGITTKSLIGLTPGISYYFRIRAYSGEIYSEYSNIVNIVAGYLPLKDLEGLNLTDSDSEIIYAKIA